MNVYTHIGFDDSEEELKRMEEFRNAQAEVEQKMFKVILYRREMTLQHRLGRYFCRKNSFLRV